MNGKPGHLLGGVAFFVWLCCWSACQGCPTPLAPDAATEYRDEATEILPTERLPTELVADGNAGDLASEHLPRDADLSDEPDAADAKPDRAGGWEGRPILPWDGPSLDGGIPESYVWEKRGAGFAQRVVAFSPGVGASFGHNDFPAKIKGPPKGLGDAKGSLDVVSLGCGGSIILEFSAPLIGNGPGPDFIVFENAFFPGGGKETFAEPAQVSVSIDGKNWYAFPCQPDQVAWPYPQCAGIKAVYANPTNQIDPNDPAAAGGDAYDLADVGLPFARFVRIEDKSQLSPDASVWCGAYNAGFDLDAIGVIWGYQPGKR